MAPESEEVLNSVGQSRRHFLRTVIAGAAFAPPLIMSFSTDGLSLEATEAAISNQTCSNVGGLLALLFFLGRSGGDLVLDPDTPPSTKAIFKDSLPLSKARNNPWQLIGTWETFIDRDSGNDGFEPLVVWLGLKNSDDQGTAFDLRAEVSLGTTLIGQGETDCITGLTRNPAQARAFAIPLDLVKEVTPLTGDLALKISARISTLCPGHASAGGLRLYYGSCDRASNFGIFEDF